PRLSVVGHAIVTADGMIADAAGKMPEALRNEADWQGFQAALDVAALVVLGRLGHERHPNPGRRRLVLTRAVSTLTPDARDPLALLWNPLATPLARVLEALEIAEGAIAITGGTGVFDHFLAAYDRFELSEVHNHVLPGGTPCFGGGHPRLVLAANGLVPGEATLIDAAAGVTATPWLRRP
ncbi:MAG: dihydrofolate reductase, partial [Devosia sp.]